jgi:hypothetical protein
VQYVNSLPTLYTFGIPVFVTNKYYMCFAESNTQIKHLDVVYLPLTPCMLFGTSCFASDHGVSSLQLYRGFGHENYGPWIWFVLPSNLLLL